MQNSSAVDVRQSSQQLKHEELKKQTERKKASSLFLALCIFLCNHVFVYSDIV